MNNFTPEYIDLCKNEKVQGLKPDFFSDCVYVDFENSKKEQYWILRGNKNNWHVDLKDVVGNIIFLPTSDQLDDEIVKICDKNHYYNYELKYFTSAETWDIKLFDDITGKPLFWLDCYHEEINIAKIKFLIHLLEVQK